MTDVAATLDSVAGQILPAAERMVRIEGQVESLRGDMQRISAHQERSEVAQRTNHERTEAAMRTMADRMGDIVTQSSAALQKQGELFLARVDAMSSAFTAEIGKLADRESARDRAFAEKLDSMDNKYATKDSLDTLKTIILAGAASLAYLAWHRITGA